MNFCMTFYLFLVYRRLCIYGFLICCHSRFACASIFKTFIPAGVCIMYIIIILSLIVDPTLYNHGCGSNFILSVILVTSCLCLAAFASLALTLPSRHIIHHFSPGRIGSQLHALFTKINRIKATFVFFFLLLNRRFAQPTTAVAAIARHPQVPKWVWAGTICFGAFVLRIVRRLISNSANSKRWTARP